MLATEKPTTKRRNLFDCGLPFEECVGVAYPSHSGKPYKAHTSMDEARRCQRKWKARIQTDDGPIILLPKVNRVKIGKEGRAMHPGIRG